MVAMKQEILTALKGDEIKYNLIMQKTRQTDIVKIRWRVWKYLYDKKYTSYSIAKFFNTVPSNITNGLNRLDSKGKHTLKPITDNFMRKIYKSAPRKNRGLVIEALRLKKYTFREIAIYFDMNISTTINWMVKAVEDRDFENRSKNFVKFR